MTIEIAYEVAHTLGLDPWFSCRRRSDVDRTIGLFAVLEIADRSRILPILAI